MLPYKVDEKTQKNYLKQFANRNLFATLLSIRKGGRYAIKSYVLRFDGY